MTQSKILQSETLAMQTVKSMGLDLCPNLGAAPGKPEKADRREAMPACCGLRPSALFLAV